MIKKCLLIAMIIVVMQSIVFAELSTDKNAVIGKINSKTYTYGEYDKILNNYYNYMKSKGDKLTPENKAKLNNQCWEELIAQELYQAEIKKRKIVVTDNDILNNPPDDVKKIDNLKTNNKFDIAKYKEAVNQNVKFKESIRDYYKNGNFLYKKLLDAVRVEVKINADTVKAAWFKENDKANAKIICFDYNKITHITATEDEALSYFNAHQDEFLKDPIRKLNYMRVIKAASKSDSLRAHEKADSLYKALVGGADFAKLAQEFSQDPGSGSQGGDLGFFSKGKMVKEFEEAAFNSKVGEIIPPVLSRFGWHIIQVTDTRKNEEGLDEVSARHILIKVDTSEETLHQMKADAENIRSKAMELGSLAKVNYNNYKVEETPEFTATDKFIRGIGRFPELITFAFSNPVGKLYPQTLTAPSGDIFICEISDSLGTHHSTFDAEKQKVLDKLTKEKKIEANRIRANEFITKYTNDNYLAQAAIDSLLVIEQNDINYQTGFQSIGVKPALNKAILNANKGDWTQLIEADNNFYLALIVNRDKPDLKKWNTAKNKEIKRVREEKENTHLSQWYSLLKKNAKIEDNRSKFYDLSAAQQTQQIQLGK